ncbi:neuropeptide SIFamide receptor-like [Acyrthosiphon pisum]|uniref:G-protein coupled receptors family 1 profile domain-containing protein n=1 Tax=Acyrthosiphon pisum TaxID=7029 RepID=A0A8R2JML6_ACYPI|nr:neuropeptide SIFamide receptor-like [Acyrthosiphon pisum]
MEVPRDANQSSGALWDYGGLDGWPWQEYRMRYSPEVTVLFCIAYAAVFVVGFVGNISVVLVVYKNVRMQSSPTNIFIVNLAIADLLVIVVCVPFTLIGSITTEWRLGLVICKLVPYFQGVSVNASINTLMAISVERCLSICYPMSPVGKGVCKRVVVIIWIISLTITMPWAIYFDLQPMEEGSDNQICLESWPTVESGNLYFVLANLLLCYVLPLTVIAVCYMFIWQKVSRRKVPGEPMHNGANMVQRSKMKVITMIMYVVVLFAVSWLPLYVAFSLIKFWPLPPAVESYTVASLPVAQWLGAANSSINPLLYAIFNHRFRDGYRALLSGKICQAFDYSNSVRYLRGGRAGTVAAAAFKRTNNNNNDNGRCDRNRKTIGAIYVHAARSQLQQHTAQQRRPVQQRPVQQRPSTQQLYPPTNRLVKSSSVRETHVAEGSAGSVVQFCSTKCENSFV